MAAAETPSGATQTLFSSSLFARLTDPSGPTITSELAKAAPGTSVEDVAEGLYGERHHAHHHFERREAGGRKEGEGKGRLDAVMDKLHLGRSKGTAKADHVQAGGAAGAHSETKDRRAAAQWNAMRTLTMEQVSLLADNWRGSASPPGELFLNASLPPRCYGAAADSP